MHEGKELLDLLSVWSFQHCAPPASCTASQLASHPGGIVYYVQARATHQTAGRIVMVKCGEASLTLYAEKGKMPDV